MSLAALNSTHKGGVGSWHSPDISDISWAWSLQDFVGLQVLTVLVFLCTMGRSTLWSTLTHEKWRKTTQQISTNLYSSRKNMKKHQSYGLQLSWNYMLDSQPWGSQHKQCLRILLGISAVAAEQYRIQRVGSWRHWQKANLQPKKGDKNKQRKQIRFNLWFLRCFSFSSSFFCRPIASTKKKRQPSWTFWVTSRGSKNVAFHNEKTHHVHPFPTWYGCSCPQAITVAATVVTHSHPTKAPSLHVFLSNSHQGTL